MPTQRLPEETKPAAAMPMADVRELVLSDGPFGPAEVQKILDAIAADFAQYRVLRDAVQQLELREDLGPAGNARLGVCYFLLGRYNLATQTLERADGGALALFYLAKSAFAVEKFEKALELYQSASKAGYDSGLCTLARAETQRYLNRNKESLALLDELSGPIEQTAEYLYQRGATVAAAGGNPLEAVRLYERAVEVDPRHVGALFGLAIENDRRGNDDLALELYEKSSQRFPPHMGTLLNLGLLYEDRNQFDKARQCYQRILEIFPNNGRARLFQKDASASSEMIYDEDAQRKRDRLSQLLSIPVTDFELSVRSRNCLQKMGIGTLGDLAATTEQDLLSSKNFGETSLIEIKEMLSSKGLALGQFAGEKMRTAEVFEPQAISPDDQALLNRPIADLQLSVRARKCMVRLGVSTIGELVRHTGDELLECKNFGVTSLNEVREKLTNHGLKLRGD